MKKLMIGAAIALMALGSQAASIAWGSAGYLWDTATNSKATSITGGDIVLCLINDGENWNNGVTVLDTGVLTTSGMAAAVGRVNGSDEGNFVWTYSDGTLKNGDILTVLFKDSGNSYSQLKYVSGGTVNDTYEVAGLSGDTSMMATFEWGASDNFFGAAATPEPTPEPTSGLLLLLGFGAMALRRRRA